MPPFDLEQGKLSVRVSEGVYYQLMADIYDFDFQKQNTFLNKLIPNLVAYRAEKRRDLRDFLEKNIIHCIKDSFQDKLLYIMDDMFDYAYFDDYRENYHRHTLHFRLNKENIIKLQGFFNELQMQNQNKTSYLRNLFNEYANMRKDKREYLFFDRECYLIEDAIERKTAITCTFKNAKYTLLPYKIDLNYADGSLYLIALEMDDFQVCHAFRLCWLRDIVVEEVDSIKVENDIIKKLEYIIYEYDYTGEVNINLSQLKTD